ncbi:hypothetical protein wCauATS_12230 [Wolbachia pipientis]
MSLIVFKACEVKLSDGKYNSSVNKIRLKEVSNFSITTNFIIDSLILQNRKDTYICENALPKQ